MGDNDQDYRVIIVVSKSPVMVPDDKLFSMERTGSSVKEALLEFFNAAESSEGDDEMTKFLKSVEQEERDAQAKAGRSDDSGEHQEI